MTTVKRTNFYILLMMLACVALGGVIYVYILNHPIRAAELKVQAPGISEQQFQTSIEVARVFGRSPSCTEASPKLIQEIAEQSVRVNLDPRIFAAVVAVESGCDPMAVSSRGAIGYSQIMPKVWKDRFDFTGSVNLLNPHDNLRVGADILGGLVKQYGVSGGVAKYQGAGIGCPSCDDKYASKILSLAGRR